MTRASLIEALMCLESPDEFRAFLDDLCTPSELRAFEERFLVAQLLEDGQFSYRDIAKQTGASTTTVTRVARFLRDMPNQGYRRVLDRLKRPIPSPTPPESLLS